MLQHHNLNKKAFTKHDATKLAVDNGDIRVPAKSNIQCVSPN